MSNQSSTLPPFPRSDRSRPQRSPKRATSEREPIYRIIDAAPICHLGFASPSGQAFVIPTIHARQGDRLFFHGSPQSRLMQAIASGQPICATFTFLDGIVVARAAMHHSMNYRSVVAFGSGFLLQDETERQEAFRLTVEKLLPGHWDHCRPPNESEAKATAIAVLRIEEATLKERQGGPNDIAADHALPHWAGVLPLQTRFAAPLPDEQHPPAIPLPTHLQTLTQTLTQ